MDTTEKKMAAAILRFEDSRVTGPDSLRVSRLPAADKGGKWEICGICDGIEPAVFNRLKALLDAGRREEAWEGCLQYVLDNTAAVRSWLGSDAFPGPFFQFREQEYRENFAARAEHPRRRACGGRHPGKTNPADVENRSRPNGRVRISLHSERTAQIILPFLQTVPRVRQRMAEPQQ